ncbi:MAG: glutamine--tRNA ligase [Clostridia bacterium]|nr:glutamine--tRNA ligase [Clostridia bacterium]
MNREDIERIEPANFIEEEVKKDLLNGTYNEVVTRCPPEPSGYWHIGHCKAWLIDFETARKFGGYTNLRMDDTNPTKEDGNFAESYLADLEWLGCFPKKVIYASEAYFDKMYELAEKLIMDGKAYVCELSAEDVARTRGTLTSAGENSPYRDRPAEESLRLFRDMKAGKFKDGEVTLRAKIDMASPNINMRDPVIYRVLHATHYKTGDKWCIYPMYDFAHPIEDALEGITHSICDISFEDHRPLYNWFIQNCFPDMKNPPRQIEFALFNLEYVLLGKRYLKQLVNNGVVMGWDDPRFYTIVGMRRRGITADAVKNFMLNIGITKSVSILPLSAFEYYVRDDLNKKATRAMAVLDPLKVIITNYNGEPEEIEIENNPNDENAGKHKAKFGREIYIEKEDFSLAPPPKYNRLVEGGIVRLKGAYIIKCNKAVLDKNGEVDYLECEYFPDTKSGCDNSGMKCKGTIHFVEKSNSFEVTIREFKNLVKQEYLEPSKALASGVSVEELIDSDTLVERKALAENFLKTAQVGDKFQFMRKGFYCMDKDSTEENFVFNSTISLKDTYKK